MKIPTPSLSLSLCLLYIYIYFISELCHRAQLIQAVFQCGEYIMYIILKVINNY